MPNYVTNKLHIAASEDRLFEILDAIKPDNGYRGAIDFNKLIPMPESLDITEGSITDTAISAYLQKVKTEGDPPETIASIKTATDIAKSEYFSRIDFHMTEAQVVEEAERMNMSAEDLYRMGQQYIQNYQQYGATTWYKWRIQNWGAKWNASAEDLYEDSDSPDLEFLTAWSCPLPIIGHISELFPDVTLTIRWADEDLGSNVGELTIQDGEVLEEHIPERCTKEAYELAFEIMEMDPRDYGLYFDTKTNTYEYREEEEETPSLEDRISEATSRQEKDVPSPDVPIPEETR